jgi:hypothetical protein
MPLGSIISGKSYAHRGPRQPPAKCRGRVVRASFLFLLRSGYFSGAHAHAHAHAHAQREREREREREKGAHTFSRAQAVHLHYTPRDYRGLIIAEPRCRRRRDHRPIIVYTSFIHRPIIVYTSFYTFYILHKTREARACECISIHDIGKEFTHARARAWGEPISFNGFICPVCI